MEERPMLRSFRFPLLAACLLLAPAAAFADDAAIAATLVGAWEGRWEYADVGGRLTAKITSASGPSLKGDTMWYATAVGDFADSFTKAKVKDGKLSVRESTMDFEAVLSEDGSTLTGTWSSPMATGKLTLKRQPK
jgi:hypothetical protein